MTTDRGFAAGGGLPEPGHAPARLFDAELGQIFQQMRALLGISLWDMARAVGGEAAVIANLEAGALDELPPWPELARLIDGYAALTGIDPKPIWARLLKSQTHSYAPARQVAAPMTPLMMTPPRQTMWAEDHTRASEQQYEAFTEPSRPPAEPLSSVDVANEMAARTATARRTGARNVTLPAPTSVADRRTIAGEARRAIVSVGRGVRRGLKRRALAVVALAIPIMLVLTARLTPSLLYGAISPLPQLVGMPLRAGLDGIVAGLAPVRDGLTWIDVGDPAMRKTDKLRAAAR